MLVAATGVNVEPQSPLAVAIQDNQHLHETHLTGNCEKAILDALGNPRFQRQPKLDPQDRSSAVSNHTAWIKLFQKSSTAYLALSAINNKGTGDQVRYSMFDAGNALKSRSSQCLPAHAGDPWVRSRNASMDFRL